MVGWCFNSADTYQTDMVMFWNLFCCFWQTDFWPEMNNKISHMKGLQRTIPDRLGKQSSTKCTRPLYVPPTNFFFPMVAKWYLFRCCGRKARHTTNDMIFDQNEQQNISFERVAEDNTRLVGYTSIHHTHTYKVPIMLRFLWRL